MNPKAIIEKYYYGHEKAMQILIEHSEAVAKKALQIARNINNPDIDLKFIEEACMIHDIGIIYTNAPDLACFGEKPYICHGYLGREIIEKEGYPKHALVCERHTGIGLTEGMIREQKLPIPVRNMVPESLEEIIICYADTFFSKSKGQLGVEKPLDKVLKSLRKHGEKNAEVFMEWHTLFNV